MLAFIRRSILLGIVTAVVLLVVFPELRTKMIQPPQVSLTTVQTDQPPQLSYNFAVRRASPAVVNIYNRRYNAEDRLKLSTQGLGSGVIMSDKATSSPTTMLLRKPIR